jgi:hypothetical protein
MSSERNNIIPGELIDVAMTPVNPLCPFPALLPSFDITVNASPVVTLLERKSDDGAGNRSVWKPFQHFKSVFGASAQSCAATIHSESSGIYPTDHATGIAAHICVGYDRWIGFNYSQPFGVIGRFQTDLPPFLTAESDGSFVAPPANYDDLMQRGLASILPIVKADLSLPNFIYELKDFRAPIKKIAAVLRSPSFLGEAARAWRKTYSQLGRMTFKQLLQGYAGHYLNLKFNILPLINDIAKIRSAMSRTESRINDFVTREGKPQNRHFAFSWSEFTNSTASVTGATPGATSPFDGTVCGASRSVTYEPSVFHMQIQYNYNYTAYQRENALLLSHLDALGLNYNPAIIWNALPWSFVVDWVLGVGRYLDQMKVTHMEPVINIRRALWSIKRSRTISVVKRTSPARAPLVSLTTVKLPDVRETAYRRSLFFPAASSIQSSGLNSTEFSLGAALVIARRRR